MSYRTMTVIVTDAKVDEAALKFARDYAAREDAHLEIHCLGVDLSRYDALPAGATAVMVETGAAEAREQAEALTRWVEDEIVKGAPRISVSPVMVPQMGIDATIGRLSRYSDLVIATKPYGEHRTPLQVITFEAAIFATGAPVLVVPPQGLDATAGFRRVAVAWNEADESFRAIREALPILKRAAHVDVVMVDPPSHSAERSDPGGALCMMLSRHGVKAEVSILSRTLPRVSDVLDRFANEHEVDLIVMGAYGHSRLREALLGGATRDLLEKTGLPLLMAH